MAAILIIALLATTVAGWSTASLGLWKAYFFEPILFFLIVFNVLGRKKEYQKIILPLAGSALVLSLVAVWQKISGQFIVPDFWTAQVQRTTSLFDYPNAVGLFLAPVIMVMLGWWLYQLKNQHEIKQFKKIQLIVLPIIIVLSGLAIVLARSDGAIVAVMAAIIIFALLAGKKSAIVAIVAVIILAGP